MISNFVLCLLICEHFWHFFGAMDINAGKCDLFLVGQWTSQLFNNLKLGHKIWCLKSITLVDRSWLWNSPPNATNSFWFWGWISGPYKPGPKLYIQLAYSLSQTLLKRGSSNAEVSCQNIPGICDKFHILRKHLKWNFLYETKLFTQKNFTSRSPTHQSLL